MYTALQSLYIKGSAGDPLPTVFESLAQRGTHFLRGQLVLVCAGPGTGKSGMTLTYAVKSRVPTLYFSADSDAFTQTSRMTSILTGWTLEKSSELVRLGDLNGATPALDGMPIRFVYDASPTLDTIGDSLKAYLQLNGDYPALVVIDNITNVVTASSEEDPFSGLEMLMDVLHKLARDTGACVVGLHHVTGEYNNGNVPIPLNGVKGQITRVPELVLTMFRTQSEFGGAYLNISTVKNRAGKQDPSGRSYVSLVFDGNTMTIKDP
ncbi:AAA family ATPase [Mycobacterium paragordonae]|uniref:AAA family ATPase n=1 Tax=Mycobacterium paragordonae TaxID=1389713 RepID=A0AAJ1W0L5_9MYCO|nr:AAA family ATPase [Mycobacterium paragordonae]